MPQDVIEYSKPICDQVADMSCYMCTCRCGIKVHLRDGQLRYIESKRNAVNRGVLWGKGSAGIMNVFRKHAVKLRCIAVVLAFVVPALLMLLAALNVLPAITATVAALCVLVGLFVERWLFFAEATHVSTIYYGR